MVLLKSLLYPLPLPGTVRQNLFDDANCRKCRGTGKRPPGKRAPVLAFLNSSPSRATSAPMGNPLAIPFASVTISGTTFVCWMASHLPVRPIPVCTSSTIMSAPVLSHTSRIPSMKLFGGMMTPASPWIGSTMTAAVSCQRLFSVLQIAIFHERGVTRAVRTVHGLRACA